MKLVLFVVGVMVASVFPSAQSPKPAAGKWTATRTSDGHPDLQGIWTTHTFTPLVRPARYAGQEFLTEKEAAELATLLTQDEVDPLAGAQERPPVDHGFARSRSNCRRVTVQVSGTSCGVKHTLSSQAW